ncbi:MAG: polysaccharide deacetylase family protein [Schlesneria sp.]
MIDVPIDILMYHSISNGPGPTCINPDLFRQQMQIMAESGYCGISLSELLVNPKPDRLLPARPIVLTFDDGFLDFGDIVFPELNARGWNATLFLPAGKVGGTDDWDNKSGHSPKSIMSWQAVADLSRQGIEIGAHGVSHLDLTTLPLDGVQHEVVESRSLIEERIGRPVVSFAPPFGRTNSDVRKVISRHYQAAVGTELGRAQPTSDLFDLPRIEMWYFRNLQRWRAYLLGGARGYFMIRQLLRKARSICLGP